jgi:hypothetical protein
MVRALSAVLLLAASSASALQGAFVAPPVPAFELPSLELLQVVVPNPPSVGPQLDAMAWDLQRYERESQRLRSDLRFLLSRVRAYKHENGKPDPDPSLRWDVRRFTQSLGQLARDAQWRLNDLRYLSAQVPGKDDSLVFPAQRLADAARRLKSETNWLVFDARFGYFDFIRAGFSFEGMDLDRDSRDLDSHALDLQNDSDRLAAKVRG